MKYLVNKNGAEAQDWCIFYYAPSCKTWCQNYNPCTSYSQPCKGYCSGFSLCIVGKPGMASSGKPNIKK